MNYHPKVLTQQSRKHGTYHTDPGDLQRLLIASRVAATLVTLNVGCWQVRDRVVVHQSRSASAQIGRGQRNTEVLFVPLDLQSALTDHLNQLD